ncbi:hypothetical protein [Streptomyces chrestomyceticus]|uniref:hypothetical protein n=1 Tax=Streptomyces chrestomyceticus TaxID=68185 RepID=UPI0033F6D783
MRNRASSRSTRLSRAACCDLSSPKARRTEAAISSSMLRRSRASPDFVWLRVASVRSSRARLDASRARARLIASKGRFWRTGTVIPVRRLIRSAWFSRASRKR